MTRVRFEEDLNGEQLAAAQAPDGPVLVIAAAGTGKTRTLTYRVAYLVEGGIEAQRILLLTFTNKAAREMLTRAQALVGEAVGGLWGGTFHHMANRILRRHAAALGYKHDYTILDEDDARSLARACVEELNLVGGDFPKPDVLLSLFGLAASREVSVEGLAAKRFEGHGIEPADVGRVHRLYGQRKQELSAMDFDDLLVNGLRLFREHEDILDKYRERFLHVLVDEYQDTNVIQADWVDALAGRHNNLLVVGDDFQSIYSWRGADFRNILSFPERHPGAAIFKLETNYRSVPEILHLANACIAGNPEQFQKTLRPVRESHRKPVLVRLRDGDEQAMYVVERIRRLLGEGYRMRDIVVLYRAHYQAMELQMHLTRERLPYVITSGVRFFEQAHVKDVCSPLRLVVNPDDALAFTRLVEMLPKMGRRTSAKVWEKLGRRFDPMDAAQREKAAALMPAAAKAGWKKLCGVFAAASEKGGRAAPPDDLIERCLAAFYDDYALATFENYDRRIEDLQELIVFSGGFDDVEDFLNEMALLTNLDTEVDDPHAEDADAVRLSTVHQAKGLEWPVVLILWMAEGMFPSARSMNEGGEGEERRLFYVAATRAKDELYLCVPAMRRTRDAGMQFFPTSRFVEELPPGLLKDEAYYG
jgi:DNA helicase II / ATP-dependent DNA helicase PcrA